MCDYCNEIGKVVYEDENISSNGLKQKIKVKFGEYGPDLILSVFSSNDADWDLYGAVIDNIKFCPFCGRDITKDNYKKYQEVEFMSEKDRLMELKDFMEEYDITEMKNPYNGLKIKLVDINKQI